jgi:hypothetical protein
MRRKHDKEGFSSMPSKKPVFISLAVVASLSLAGCGIVGGGNNADSSAGSGEAAQQGGGGNQSEFCDLFTRAQQISSQTVDLNSEEGKQYQQEVASTFEQLAATAPTPEIAEAATFIYELNRDFAAAGGDPTKLGDDYGQRAAQALEKNFQFMTLGAQACGITPTEQGSGSMRIEINSSDGKTTVNGEEVTPNEAPSSTAPQSTGAKKPADPFD